MAPRGEPKAEVDDRALLRAKRVAPYDRGIARVVLCGGVSYGLCQVTKPKTKATWLICHTLPLCAPLPACWGLPANGMAAHGT